MKDSSTDQINFYDDVGSKNPVFLFFPGWLEDRTFWTPVVDLLLKNNRCISLDLMQSAMEETGFKLHLKALAQSVVGFIDNLNIKPVILVGHDLGAILTLLVNEQCPDNVLGLVLVDPPLDGATNGAMGLLSKEITTTNSLEIAQPLLNRWFVESTSSEVREKVKTMLSSGEPKVAAEQFSEAEFLKDDMGRLLVKADEKPFMIIWPDKPSGNPEKLREITQFLRQEPIAETGHFLQLEKPKVLVSLLKAFIDDIERDPRIVDLKTQTGDEDSARDSTE